MSFTDPYTKHVLTTKAKYVLSCGKILIFLGFCLVLNWTAQPRIYNVAKITSWWLRHQHCYQYGIWCFLCLYSGYLRHKKLRTLRTMNEGFSLKWYLRNIRCQERKWFILSKFIWNRSFKRLFWTFIFDSICCCSSKYPYPSLLQSVCKQVARW